MPRLLRRTDKPTTLLDWVLLLGGIAVLLGFLWQAADDRRAVLDEQKNLREDVQQLQQWYGVADVHSKHRTGDGQ